MRLFKTQNIFLFSSRLPVKSWHFSHFSIRLTTVLGLLGLLIAPFSFVCQTVISAQEEEPKQLRKFGKPAINPNVSDFSAAGKDPKIELLTKPSSQGNSTGNIPNSADLWTNAAAYPINIRDNAAVTIGNALYSFAGANPAPVANSYKFDGAAWTAIASLPIGLTKPAAVTDNVAAYIVGGFTSGATVNTLYRYDPASNNYTLLAPSPTATWNMPAVYLNGKIYKIGGDVISGGSTTSSNAVEVYDIASNTWTTIAAYPLASVSFAMAWTQNNFVYVAGGFDAIAGVQTAKTYRYDPATNTWDDAAIADLLETRWGGAAVSFNERAVIAGGSVNDSFSRSVIAWNPVANAWRNLPDLLQSRHRLAGAVLDGDFYAIGGYSPSNSSTGTNDNQRYNLAAADIRATADLVSPANGAINPGDFVTVALNLQNVGLPDSNNVTVTLFGTGGISNPSAPQNYGVLVAGGAAVGRNFSFRVPATATCGSVITLTFQINDGTNTANFTKTFGIGAVSAIPSYVENFDNVTAPSLPTGWVSAQSGAGTGWRTVATISETPPNSVFAGNPSALGISELTSSPLAIASAASQLKFRNRYQTELFESQIYDGMVLEISIPSVNGGAYQDILAAGGTFISGGYDGVIYSNFDNPLAGRQAWGGDSGGFIETAIKLPPVATGQNIRLKWRIATDSAFGAGGVNIDTLRVFGTPVCSNTGEAKTRFDFDGDGKADLAVFRPQSGTWFVQRSEQGFLARQFGANNDFVAPADFDGDGKTDLAVFRPSNGFWFRLNSFNNTFSAVHFGQAGDKPRPGDFDGDGLADIAVWRLSSGTWYRLSSSNNQFVGVQFGQPGDIPVLGNFDGDNRDDIAVWRPANGNWYRLNSSNNQFVQTQFGQSGDVPVAADYDGDEKTDLAVFRPQSGIWYRLNSSNGQFVQMQFGANTDVPVAADYDGDNKSDIAVWRPSSGVWYRLNSTNGQFAATQFGQATDIAVPSAFNR